MAGLINLRLLTDFFNKIGQKPLQPGRSRAPDGSCAERGCTPSLARISRLKTPRAGSSPGAG